MMDITYKLGNFDYYASVMSKFHLWQTSLFRLTSFASCLLRYSLITVVNLVERPTALQRLGRQRKVIVSVNHIISLLPKLLQGSDLVSVLPEHLAKTLPNVYLQAPPIKIEGFTMMMTWHEHAEQNIANQWFREVLLEVVR